MLGLLAVSLSTMSASQAVAGSFPGGGSHTAAVRFDTPALVSCREITSEEFLESYPDSRLVEAIFRVSALHQGIDRHSLEHLVQIYSDDRSIQVMGFSPETTLMKDINGSVAVEKTSEGSASIGIDAVGTINNNAKLNGHASAGGKTIKTERYEQVPPSYLVLASGIMARGAGAYFKVRSTPDTTVEGGQDYTLRFRVPSHWRGGSFQIACIANRIVGKTTIKSTDDSVGAGRFVVATFLAGDVEASRVARRYVNAEHELRLIASSNAREISQQAYPSVIDRIGKAMQVNRPKIPANWLDEIVFQSQGRPSSFERHLPADVQNAVRDWRTSRTELYDLSFGIGESVASK